MDRPIKVSLLSTSVWLSLPQDLRAKLAKLFELKKSGTPMTDIGPRGAVILSDGYTPVDLIPITIVKMQEILGTTDTDFYQLFDNVLNNIDGIIDGSYMTFMETPVDSLDEHAKILLPTKRKYERKTKKA